MKIIESSIIGKKSPEACEDGMVVTDDFIAVIDGSTSKTPKHLNPDMKNGRYAMMLISEYIREELKTDASVDEFCQGVTAYIYNKVYEKLGVEERLKEHPEERLTASAILYSRTRNEVWMVGDCQAIIDGKLIDLFHGDEKTMYYAVGFSLCIMIPSFIQLIIRLKKVKA